MRAETKNQQTKKQIKPFSEYLKFSEEQTVEQIKRLFKTHQIGEHYYTQDEVKFYLMEGFRNLEQYSIFFKHQQYEFRKYEDKKTMRRKVYVHFQCEKCGKHWTSILGVFEINFTFINENKKSKISQKQFILKWQLKLYSERCKKCQIWNKAKLYYSQLKACQLAFWKILYNIHNYIKQPKHNKDRKKLKQNHHHLQEYCEACKKGVCFNIPKEEQKKQKPKQLISEQKEEDQDKY